MSEQAAPGGGRLPVSAYVFAWLCLAAQLPGLATRGLSDSDGVWVVLSMVLSALIVGWFAAGVLRGRTVRLVLVWILLGLGALFTAIGIVADLEHVGGWDLLLLLVTIGQVGALVAFCSTDYFRWQRSQPADAGPEISTLVAIAVVVGLLGGMTAAADGTGTPTQLRVGL
ncbi:hypothetical protein ASC77_14720 [Nocardioides sp. Root1257]|uniref:hypothetical protein n=1 Tax=unclassified Nocardioides TaxID=2615069 RepID=UPI0006FD8579|nr:MULTISPECIES: hypothetical protein [unclassified Nocardioides]KQW47681.1 hypothetical protein ASC77_14720 [Nocardioides sp. Root1257]KRC45836.1 hypothetical protein ASE24_14720 [Nocardioides sp. Root224]